MSYAWLEASKTGCGPGDAKCLPKWVDVFEKGHEALSTTVSFCPFHAAAKEIVLQLAKALEQFPCENVIQHPMKNGKCSRRCEALATLAGLEQQDAGQQVQG